MTKLDVRIVQMEPMRVASVLGFGPGPEELAGSKMLAFMESRGLRFEDVRWFGFNNPNPSPGSPNYGYEVWITVGPEVEGDREVTIKEVPVRRYAVTHCDGLETIGKDWQQLVLWFEESAHGCPPHWAECLEHLLVPPSSSYEEYQFDLYLPLAD